MEPPARIDAAVAAPVGLGLLAVSVVAAALAGVPHAALRPLVAFAVAFPLLWIVLATIISYTTARALRVAAIELPSRTRAMEHFSLALTLSNDHGFPAVGVLTSARFSIGGVTIESGPWAEMPIVEAGHAATSRWTVLAKRRGTLSIGPFRAAVELPGSAIRATAVFGRVRAVTVLPAAYRLQPFIDALLAGRHSAVGRFQKMPVATEEYVGAREYRPGDSPKLIHRVLSLRTRDPSDFYVREFQDPSREDLSVVLDTAAPIDGDDTLHRYRLEKAVSFVSALCRALADRRLTVRFVCQLGPREVMSLHLRPRSADLDRLDTQLAHVGLAGDRATLSRVLRDEVRRHGAAVIFVTLRPREPVEQQRLPLVTLTPDHVPVFTRDVVSQ